MKIPIEALSEDALTRMIEEFVLREGTDYGREYSLAQKVADVRAALRAGRAQLLFDPTTETMDIQPTES